MGYLQDSQIFVVVHIVCPFGIPLGKHILKMYNLNFVFGKKKKAWFAKTFAFKNHFLRMKLKTSFSKCDFGKKHDKKMGYQTDPVYAWPLGFQMFMVGQNFTYLVI